MLSIRSNTLALFALLALLIPSLDLCHKDCACGKKDLKEKSLPKKQRVSRKKEAKKQTRTKKGSTKKTKRKRKKGKSKKKKVAAQKCEDCVACDCSNCEDCSKSKQQTKKDKRISRLDYNQLKKEKIKLVANGKHENAIKYIERMVPLCTDLGELAELMLELADLFFDRGCLIKAEHLYSEFANLYPGHEKAEYASYKGIICCYWKTLDHRRDQSKTKEAIERAHSFLKRRSVFTTYADQVDEILHACHEKLLESEMNIFHFYLKRGDYLAAQTRLENMEKEFLSLLPNKEALLISLACELAEKQNNIQVLEEKKLILAQRFPEFVEQPTVVATGKQQKRAADRF